MSNLKGPAGYMLSQVLNKRTKADNLQIAKREYDEKWLLWQYNFEVHEDYSFSEFWQIVGVYDTEAGALLAYQGK